jgi:hypothetical protein
LFWRGTATTQPHTQTTQTQTNNPKANERERKQKKKTPMKPELKALVDQWLQQDPYPDTRKEITDLVEQGKEQELEKRMMPRIAFGTAGRHANYAKEAKRERNFLVY